MKDNSLKYSLIVSLIGVLILLTFNFRIDIKDYFTPVKTVSTNSKTTRVGICFLSGFSKQFRKVCFKQIGRNCILGTYSYKNIVFSIESVECDDIDTEEIKCPKLRIYTVIQTELDGLTKWLEEGEKK